MAYDILIRGGTVHDGLGGAPQRADIAIAEGRIVAIGRPTETATKTIDATGLTVAPGFIDIHSHSDYTLLVDPRAVSAVAQGVTLEVIGNCGFGCGPIGDPRLARTAIYGFDDSIKLSWTSLGGYLERLQAAKPAVNVMTLVPNGQLRLATVGLADRAATPEETARMRTLMREGLADGAIGYSIGLEYPAEVGSSEAELIAIASEAGRAGGLYATHTRKRAENAAEAVEEAIRTARAAEVRLQVSHLIPRSGDDESRRCIDAVEAAQARGQEIAFDMHTRLYGTTMLSTLLPPWTLDDGIAGLKRHLADPAARARIKTFGSIISSVGDWDKVVLLDLPGHPDESRRSFGELGRERRRDPHDVALDILADEAETLHRPMVILHTYTESAQKLAFTHPLCMPGSDATDLAPDGPLAGQVFHGAYTWAAWFWRAMVREWRLLKPEEAINRLTGLPASILGLTDRGVIRVGARADIAMFDASQFGERGTTFEPNQLAQGMRHVIVNGVLTLTDGAQTGQRAGEVLRRQGPPDRILSRAMAMDLDAFRERMRGKAQTVLGTVEPGQLGQTMMHEHLMVQVPHVAQPPADPAKLPEFNAKVDLVMAGRIRFGGIANCDNCVLDDPDTAIAEVGRYCAVGGRTIVDATSIGVGRDPETLLAIAKSTRAHIVMGCSYYVDQNYPPEHRVRETPPDELTARIVKELVEGVDDTGIRPGLIGEVGCSWPITPTEVKVLRASARAQQLTGAPLMIHPGRHGDAPFQIVDILREAGADLSRTIMCHIDRTLGDTAALRRLAETGCVIEFDLFGTEGSYFAWELPIDMPNDAARINLLQWLIAEGFGDQLVISHDICFKDKLGKYGGHGYSHIIENVVPLMRRKGMDEDAIATMLVDTPQRLLAFA